MTIIINPGAGPVGGVTTLEDAYRNMDQLIKDAGLAGATYTRDVDAEEEDGRFSFNVAIPGAERFGPLSVDMPGIPLEQVRYTGAEGQNIWHFPRLYVDGSSWVWKFAVECLRDWVRDHEEAEEEERQRIAEIRRERDANCASEPKEGP